jgi:hypothetical protein
MAFEMLWQKKGNRDAALRQLLNSGKIEQLSIPGLEYELLRIANPNMYNNLDFATQLSQRGVAVLKVIDDVEELAELQTEFLETLHSFPEYNDNVHSYVAGGFAALANPGSFHNPLVRKLRRRAYERLLPGMRTLKAKRLDANERNNLRFETLFDRMMYRFKGMSPVAEAWHRDVMPRDIIGVNDEVFGGWINLDSVSQYFSMVPGSHLNIKQTEIQSGFDTLSSVIERELKTKDGWNNMSKKDKEKHVMQHVKAFSQLPNFNSRIEIPPMCMVIFPQYILHEVVATKAKHNMMRLFTGWRMCLSDTSLYTSNRYGENIIDQQAVCQLPGGMTPPMYSRNHISYFVSKQFDIVPGVYHSSLSEWSRQDFKEVCLGDEKQFTSKQLEYVDGDATNYRLVERHMHSLEHYNFEKYEEYSQEERQIYVPRLL